MTVPDALRATVSRIRRVVVLTGAGISAESGVPTFRGEQGLWKQFRPEELANVDAFLSNPSLVWEWYAYRRKLLSDAQPNAGHRALVQMERLVEDFVLVTQNVDGLHQVAGSTKVLEIHGNIRRNHCQHCRRPAQVDLLQSEGPPKCDYCGGLVRPSVVWFGEPLPMEAFGEGDRAARRCDLFIAVGTSGVVYPAASLPLTAKNAGAYFLEINPESTDLSRYADGALRASASDGLTEVVTAIASGRNSP
ncbi:MAG: NAD-dependent deacylase [Bacteroidetes bacterium]|jgi:NAD-dependent deacetylase|nr:NAD-dependent deacylase [Bacteroidota bacterium]